MTHPSGRFVPVDGDAAPLLSLAFLDELVEHPELLADYARAFAGRTDATLFVLAPGLDPGQVELRLRPLALELGLEDEGSAEVVVLTDPAAAESLAGRVGAVFTRVARNGPLSRLPQTADVAELLAPGRPADAPGFTALAFLDELLGTPDLLIEYVGAFAARSDARLVVLAPRFAGAERALERELAPLVSVLGLDREGSANVVVLTQAESDELAAMAAAVYTRTLPEGPLGSLPRAGDAAALLRLAEGGDDGIRFTCNVCGADAVAAELPREGASCDCGSSARFRSVVRAISLALFDDDLPLERFPARRELRGIGLTDWGGYAEPLAERLSYRNTFLHTEPRFDVTAPPRELEGTLDFVVATEVFEHVARPVEAAFANVRRLLKPGGVLVLTVPWRRDGLTVEHFPVLRDAEVVERDGARVLVGTDESGARREFERLVFHGGEGATLELRQFALDSLLDDLSAAGFGEVEVLDAPDSPHGVDWSPERDNSWPILAWAPDPLPLEAEGFLAVALADEISSEPRLLHEFATAFRPGEATLVVYAPDGDAAAEEARLAPLCEALDANVLLLVLERSRATERRLADAAHVLLSARTSDGSLARLARVSDAAGLRAVRAGEARPGAAPRAARGRREPAERPNYLLVTYDSCRLDVLREAHTPVLDSYAPIVAAQTPANFTYAAHQAFFVGMLPNAIDPLPFYNRFVNQLLGLGAVGEIQVVDKACVHRVGSDANLVAGLSAAGYQTVGTGAMNWFKQRSLTQWFERFSYTGTDADAQIAFLRGELDPERPFFGFVNFGETHDPFDFAGKPDRCPVEVQSRLIAWPPAQNGVPVGRDCPAWEHQKRSAEFLDSRLPALFEGLPGDTIVILCGDHGEAFGEDGYWGHGVNHPTVLTVPLSIFRLDRRPL